MPNIDRDELAGSFPHSDTELLSKLLLAASIIVSGKNPDDTDFKLPIDLGGATLTVDNLVAEFDQLEAATGAATDAAVVTDANGTISGKLRGLVKMLASLIDSATHWLTTKDGGPAWTSAHGVSGVPFTSADATSAADVSDAPTGGQKLVITDLILSSDTELSLTLRCETTDAVIAGPFYLAAGSTVQATPRSKAWKLATADKKLQVIASVAGNISVDAHFYSEV